MARAPIDESRRHAMTDRPEALRERAPRFHVGYNDADPPMPERKTPREILSAAGRLDKDVIAVKYLGLTVDLHTPTEATAAELAPVRATDGDGLAVIRHSTAHVMADAVQRLFPGTKVTIGPA